MGEKSFYSIRTGKNPNSRGFELEELRNLFMRLYSQLTGMGTLMKFLVIPV
jgi:hypothetical protein